MLFDWYDFFLLAEKLVERFPHDEPELRTAVSRSYYAAYHLTLKKFPDLHKGQADQKGVHAKIIEGLINDPRRKTLGLAFERLKNARIHADYSPNSLGNNKAENHIKEVKKFLRDLNAYSPKSET
jgi:uncharacterized protein (UPF0332 family)